MLPINKSQKYFTSFPSKLIKQPKTNKISYQKLRNIQEITSHVSKQPADVRSQSSII